MEHKHDHTSFLIDLAGRMGPPIFAATMVACLLAGRMQPSHLLLMGAGILLIILNHWYVFHKKSKN
ncbi:MAG: hypothetical protein ACR2NW_02695 [Thermodesulfobacteriota bacterium]